MRSDDEGDRAMGVAPMSVERMSAEGLVGLSLMLLATASAVALGLGIARRGRYLLGLVGAALLLQVFHTSEHLIQAGYWLLHPFAPAYMTPWANAASQGVGAWTRTLGGAGTPMARGMEPMHLAMNLVFLCGCVGMLVLAARSLDPKALRSCRQLVALQGLHVAEHALLTVTLFTGGVARGLSTLFGAIPPSSAGAVAYRVLFHFAVNSAGVILAIRAGRDLLRVATADRTASTRPPRRALARTWTVADRIRPAGFDL